MRANEEKDSRNDSGPHCQSESTTYLDAQETGLARQEKSLVSVEETNCDDSPQATAEVDLGGLQRIVDL